MLTGSVYATVVRRPPAGSAAVTVASTTSPVVQAADPTRTAPPVLPATAQPTTTATTAAPHPITIGTLIARNVGSDQAPDRVFVAPGQRGTDPRFSTRAGVPVRIAVTNRNGIVHSFTLDQARLNIDVFAGTTEAITFRAPTRPGTYTFYCRYRKLGMSGRLVVR